MKVLIRTTADACQEAKAGMHIGPLEWPARMQRLPSQRTTPILWDGSSFSIQQLLVREALRSKEALSFGRAERHLQVGTA